MSDAYDAGLLRELDRAEKILVDADRQLESVQLDRDVAAIKFGAIRDAAFQKLRGDPYRFGVEWPEPGKERGRYRFLRAHSGWAVVAVLHDSDEPLDAGQITGRLVDGGFENVDQRSINGVLQGSNEIERVEPTSEREFVRYRIKSQPNEVEEDGDPLGEPLEVVYVPKE